MNNYSEKRELMYIELMEIREELSKGIISKDDLCTIYDLDISIIEEIAIGAIPELFLDCLR